MGFRIEITTLAEFEAFVRILRSKELDEPIRAEIARLKGATDILDAAEQQQPLPVPPVT